MATAPEGRDGFEFAVICALKVERDAVQAQMEVDFKDLKDRKRGYGRAPRDRNAYTTGLLGGKPVVLACLRDSGTLNAATVTTDMHHSFPNLKLCLVVGVAGGAPQAPDGTAILLGDLIISTAVIQYDLGRQYPGAFKIKDEIESTLGRHGPEIALFVRSLEGPNETRRLAANTNEFVKRLAKPPAIDQLFPANERHKHQDDEECEICRKCVEWDDPVCERAEKAGCDELKCKHGSLRFHTPNAAQLEEIDDGTPQTLRTLKIHFGRIGSASTVMKSGIHRDRLVREWKVQAFEMEGAGTWDQIPTIIVKSVCDYADSHKNKDWQEFAAVAAAACAKAMLEAWDMADDSSTSTGPRRNGECRRRVVFCV